MEKFSDLYKALYDKVKSHMGWDDTKTTMWFVTPNPNIGGATPTHLLLVRPEKCKQWIEALIKESTA